MSEPTRVIEELEVGPVATDDPGPPASVEGEAGNAPEAEPRRATPPVDRSVCLCAGLGPMLTQALRTLSVPEEVRRSVQDTEREALRLLRTLIEMRLSSLGTDEGARPEPRGTSLTVE